MGAATAAPVSPRAPATGVKASWVGRQSLAIVDVTLSSSYATGGDTFDFATIGLVGVQPLFVDCSPNAGYVAVYNRSTKKMLLFQQSAATGALTEVANASNNSAVVVRCLVIW